MAAPPAIVAVLRDRYSFERKLGSGGMATVYLARDLQHGTTVAVKVLRPDLMPIHGVERFGREIRITSHLHHPGILPVLDSGEADGLPYYVTPYVDGESLAQRLNREGQLPIADTIDIACKVADALEVAHAEGFVHRDIKPSNILLAGDQVILADFGIARAIDVLTGEKLTESGVALGTPAYMSPEQSAGGTIDRRSDVYSLACVMFEMLAGSPPFTGATSQSILARHAVDPVPSLRTVRVTVSPALEHVIVKALAKVPADRYTGALDFKKALERIDQTAEVTAPRRVSRHRRIYPALVALATLAAAGLTWRLASPRSRLLDPNRVMVYPLVVPAQPGGSRTIGEDVATMIGTSLDGAGPLRWIDGWPLLDSERRDDIRKLDPGLARTVAGSKRCAFYLTGRLVIRGDSADVFLQLNDVRGDSTVAKGRASGLSADAWRLGLQAVNGVLPRLIPGGPVDLTAEWKDRNPAAIASFLLGEAAFRRVHLTDALTHYRDAVRDDSSFGLAAIRGAQAATWNHRPAEAASLIHVAIGQNLAPRYRHFALGYEAYLTGQADSAAAEFHRALEVDPELAVAWMLLGEVYTHLLPVTGNPDSLAEASFEEAQRLDPQATNVLLHLIEIRLRRGQVASAEPMVRQFLAAEPDTMLAAQIRIMDDCVRRGPEQVDWSRGARAHPLAVLAAGNMLKGGGAQFPCAVQAFTAVIHGDTAGDPWGDARRWSALIGLQAIMLAEGRIAEVTSLIDSSIGRGLGGSSLYLLDAELMPELEDRAKRVALQDQTQFGRNYLSCPYPNRLWVLGLWEAHAGSPDAVAAIGRELESRGRKGTSAYERVGAHAMTARVALARADSGGALGLFSALLAEGVSGEELAWDLTAPRGSERLALARLLMARGEFQRALEVASVFDSAWPIVYTLYLPASLRLRAEAATALHDAASASRYENRLAALRGSRAVATQ